MKTLAEIQIERPKIIRRQISDSVRSLILSGEIKIGTKFPSTQELAATWGTDVKTVHKALTPLVKEGLLTRTPKVGTFVEDRAAQLTCVGVYYTEDIWTNYVSAFQQSVHAALKHLLNHSRIQTRVWVDPRPATEQNQTWDTLARAAQNREIQALMTTATDYSHIHWLQKLPIPFAFLGSANLPNKVTLDLPQLAELSLRHLAEQGCRSVGVIAPNCPSSVDPSGGRHEHAIFLERFVTVAGELNLTIKNQWMGVAQRPDELRGESEEHFGYRKFCELWRLPERPDGLVILPDNTAKGALMALLEKQVRVPQELKLVLHKNAGIDLLCPVPAALVISDERDMARALMAQVQKQTRGEVCRPVFVPGILQRPS
ncbi:MAG: GntR family transcriptional regulator [Verrucomicrobia bacterium]|nr:GntR family transcriptional regulator [Verrucomicrobiota bacterium]